MAKKLRRWLLYYPLLVCIGCHTLLTGSPIPLWYVEKLENPQSVASIQTDALVLADGRRIRLPYLEALPVHHPAFVGALQDGIEVRPDGEVVALMKLQRFCGNDPVVHRKVRINLSDLAAVLHPDGLDRSILDSDVIANFKQDYAGITESVRVDLFLVLKMRSFRKHLHHILGLPEPPPEPVEGRSGEHDRRTGGLLL